MRALVQRVSRSSVCVDGATIGEIGHGVLILICAMDGDTSAQSSAMAAKIGKLRIFKDDAGKMNRSLIDTGGAALIVSQFTLAADTSRGNRPGFSAAAKPDIGRALYEQFIRDMGSLGIKTAQGAFGADMAVSLVNDGPVTIWIDL
ncbi:D-aminoacyl-tRNA deacylase [Yoonia sediminilitoris]|uniref:D-aminoacyl-tRNA deacylase n=1 Tax=Yoonia sediminilitoris TaxID=1286148 RepID=UPI000D338600|nr:D-aminoacyl-tRNA deacylase [Yoonia sediminilitoris]